MFQMLRCMSLLNVGKREWSNEILDGLGWKRDWLPEVTESTEVTSKVTASIAGITGLIAGTPVVAGEVIVLHRQLEARLWRKVKYR